MPLPVGPKRSKKNRMASFRLSEAVLDMLTRLTEITGQTRGRVLEMLITEEMKWQEENMSRPKDTDRLRLTKKN